MRLEISAADACEPANGELPQVVIFHTYFLRNIARLCSLYRNERDGKEIVMKNLVMKNLVMKSLVMKCLIAVIFVFFAAAGSLEAVVFYLEQFDLEQNVFKQNLGAVTLEELLNTQISTAAKYEQTSSQAPASVTIITSEDIERYGYRTLDEALMQVRGFYSRNDRNYVTLGVRGFSRPSDYDNRILVLINGHTTNENIYGAPFIGTELGLDLDIIERIEVVRGPGSALYGTGAMFAVVNIITKDGNLLDGLKVTGETGSYGRIEGSAAYGKRLGSGMDILVSGLWGDIEGQDLYFEEYDDPETNHGVAENLDWDKYYGLFTRINYGAVILQGFLSSREKGIPTGAWEMKFNDDDARTLDERGYVELKYDEDISASQHVMSRGYFDYYRYRGTYPYEEGNWYDGNDGNWAGGEFEFRWDLRPDNRLTLGTEYQKHLRADHREWDEWETYFDEDFPFHVTSFYLQDEYQMLENLSVTFGLRHDEYSTVGSATTPRGAIVYNPLRTSTLKFLYGEAFRAPNVYEVHYESVDEAKGNPDLNPEEIRTAEVVWEQRIGDQLFGLVSVYNYEMRNLIDQVIDPADSLFQFQNVSKVRANGVELELTARLKMGLLCYANYIVQKAEDADREERLTNSPAQILKAGLVCPVLNFLSAAAELQYETKRITVYETETEPYFVANVNLATKPLLDRAKVSLLIRNLFDEEYSLPGGYEHEQDAIVQDGRTMTAKVELMF
jgi:outer membrane receptor for ferrienterochelin and colicins